MIKEDIKSSRFNYILCDSKDALNYFYKNGLNKKTKVLTHSPGIELKKNINSINLFKNLSKREFILFNETINTLSLNVFNSLKSEKGVEHELAVLISIFCSDFNKFLLKACHIKRKYLGKKVLFIKVSEKVGKADLINPPWDCFSKELNIKTLTYEPKDLHNSFIKEVKANYLKRTYLGGTETFIYRLLCKIYKFFNTLKKKNIIILSENELLIEVTHYLMLNGFFPIDFKNIANKFFENDINLTNLILKKNT